MLAQFHENFYPATIIAVKPMTDGEHNRRALSLSLSLSLSLAYTPMPWSRYKVDVQFSYEGFPTYDDADRFMTLEGTKTDASSTSSKRAMSSHERVWVSMRLRSGSGRLYVWRR
eukprot:COSAG03_NODE_4163_length_1656_cov_1.267823_1_plen_114_part_00